MTSIQLYDENDNTLTRLCQYDTNRTIKIKNYAYSSTGSTMVYFSNSSLEKALGCVPTVSGTTLTVKVPDSLLTYAEKIQVYVTQEISTSSIRKTYCYSEIMVKERKCPADYVASNDTTYISITALKSELESAVNSVETKLANGDFKGDKGDKGDKGNTGAAGKDGTTIKVGSTTTGTTAKVTGVSDAAANTLTLNFTLPTSSSSSSSSGSTDYPELSYLPRSILYLTYESKTSLSDISVGAYDIFFKNEYDEVMTGTDLYAYIADAKVYCGDILYYNGSIITIIGRNGVKYKKTSDSNWSEISSSNSSSSDISPHNLLSLSTTDGNDATLGIISDTSYVYDSDNADYCFKELPDYYFHNGDLIYPCGNINYGSMTMIGYYGILNMSDENYSALLNKDTSYFQRQEIIDKSLVKAEVKPCRTSFFDYESYMNLVPTILEGYLLSSDGSHAKNTDYPNSDCTSFISVGKDKTYYIGNSGKAYTDVTIGCLYDTNYDFVSTLDSYFSSDKSSFTSPQNGYVILCNSTGLPDKLHVNENALFPYSENQVMQYRNERIKSDYLPRATITLTGEENLEDIIDQNAAFVYDVYFTGTAYDDEMYTDSNYDGLYIYEGDTLAIDANGAVTLIGGNRTLYIPDITAYSGNVDDYTLVNVKMLDDNAGGVFTLKEELTKSTNVSLAHNADVRIAGTLPAQDSSGNDVKITCTFPVKARKETYRASLSFSCGDTAPTMSFPSVCVFTGDNCSDGVFVPQANTSYYIELKNLQTTENASDATNSTKLEAMKVLARVTAF